MKRIASIQLRGDKTGFVREWNNAFPDKIEFGVIQLDYDSTVHREFLARFAAYEKEHKAGISQRILVSYSPADLLSSELLELDFNRFCGVGGNHFGEAYRSVSECSRCRRLEEEQVAALTVNLEDFLDEDLPDGDQLSDLCVTRNAELLISERGFLALRESVGNRLGFQPVRVLAGNRRPAPRFYQIETRSRLGPAIPPSPVERTYVCPNCLLPTQVLFSKMPGAEGSEFYFGRKSLQGSLLFRTADRFGRGPRYTSAYFIDNEFYQLLVAHELTGYSVQPAHLVD